MHRENLRYCCRIFYLVAVFVVSPVGFGKDMITVSYERHEFHFEPESRKAPLSSFVYDVPYFGACGIFPPLHIMNEFLLMGGFQGGMGPGATWKPFKFSKQEYIELVNAIKVLEPKSLGKAARYTSVKYEFDNSFDHIEDWVTDVCEKHKKSFHRKMGNS